MLALALGLGGLSGGATAAAPAGQTDELRVALTYPGPGAVLAERVTITGWAVEPAASGGEGVNASDVQIWLGAPDAGGNRLDYARYGLPSDAATTFFGPAYRDSGFEMQWNPCSFPPRPYELWAFVSSLARPGLSDYAKVVLAVAPCPAGLELYRADWSTSRGGSTARAEQQQSGDAWAIRLLQPGGSAAGVEGVYGDVLAEVTAQLAGRDDGYYFLDFRIQPGPGNTLTDGFYRLTVHPDSARFRLGLSRPGPDPIDDLVPWTASPAIRRGVLPNRLGVAMEGARLRLYANDTLLADVTNGEFPWGKLRFGVATGDDPTAGALFRDFVVTSRQAAP
jgi:hypothetical protein